MVAGARADLAAGGRFYARQSPRARRAFFAVIRGALQTIRQAPFVYALHPAASGRAGVRRFVVRAFPYVIPYAVEQDAVVVFAVAHTARAPDYWLRRLDE